MTPPAAEIASSIYGAWRLLRLDPGGMSFFNRSYAGAWRSFFAAVIVAPGFVALLFLSPAESDAGALRIVLVHAISYCISWVAFPVVVHQICVALGKTDKFIDFLTAINWSEVIQLAIYLPAALIAASGLLPGPAGEFLSFAALLITLSYQWFVTRTALKVSGFGAVGFVCLDLLIDLILISMSDGMLQVSSVAAS